MLIKIMMKMISTPSPQTPSTFFNHSQPLPFSHSVPLLPTKRRNARGHSTRWLTSGSVRWLSCRRSWRGRRETREPSLPTYTASRHSSKNPTMPLSPSEGKTNISPVCLIATLIIFLCFCLLFHSFFNVFLDIYSIKNTKRLLL